MSEGSAGSGLEETSCWRWDVWWLLILRAGGERAEDARAGRARREHERSSPSFSVGGGS